MGFRPRVTDFGIMKLCRGMQSSDPEGKISLFAPNSYGLMFFLHRFRLRMFHLFQNDVDTGHCL